jgi:hypothetical protein
MAKKARGGTPTVNHPHGSLSLAPDADAPLLIVFGGIDVSLDGKMVRSGIYMWNYMTTIKDKFHIFVAYSNHVNGTESYYVLTKALEANGVNPSRQILYLFSGGYGPGMDLLGSGGAKLFSSIYLVDIWMGNGKDRSGVVPKFYRALADRNAAKLSYIYTNFGANNNEARDYIARKLGGTKATLVKGGGMETHLRTNKVAVAALSGETA